MNDINWGRNKKTMSEKSCSEKGTNLFMKIIGVGCAACLTLIILNSDMTPQYAPVSAPATENTENDGEVADADPFGYFNGEWNLWEFIGDSFSSLLPIP